MHPSRSRRRPCTPTRRLAAGDQALHRVPRAVSRRPRGSLAAEPGPHDPGRASRQGRSAVPDLARPVPQLGVRHRQVPRRRPPGRGQPLQPGRRGDHGRFRQRRPARPRRHLDRPHAADGVLPQRGGRHVRGSERRRPAWPDQLGGLVCYQADYNNDGRLDIFIPRGAWLPHADPAELCCATTATGRFTDVTEEAGLLDPVNSNAAAWADYDNDGWLDLFVGCERQPNRLYHNRGDGTFEEVAAQGRCRSEPTATVLQGLRPGSTSTTTVFPTCSSTTWRGPAELFHNNRDGTFTDVTHADGHRRAASRASPAGRGTTTTTAGSTSSPPVRPHARKTSCKGLLGQPHTRHSNRLFRNKQGKGSRT